ncbi:MAG: hypothetical protein KGZ42_05635 [Melioribacter sp.]|nr:hypothetical protein [Melioribacter sp.]
MERENEKENLEMQYLKIINLSDELLVKMFYELKINKQEEKRLMFLILKELVSRNKLNMLASSKHVN